jgi:hypothetical protein
MKQSLFAFLLLPILACAAQSPFDGTWTVFLHNPPPSPITHADFAWEIQNGTYKCSACPDMAGPIQIKADGTDQPVEGRRAFDTLAIKIVDDKTILATEKRDGKIIESVKNTLSADDKILTRDATSYLEGSKQPFTETTTLARVAAGPAGSHPISGSWRLQPLPVTPIQYTVTYKSSPDGLMMSTTSGKSFDAKFDGKDYPIKGTTGRTVSLTKVNDIWIDATNKLDGKIVEVNHMTVSADGKTLTIKQETETQSTMITLIGTKQ